jgi:glycosyltransferase involved in cell wall biosynthesis
MPSIVIAAHNEERVIGRCLDGVLAGARHGEFDVIVVANGCSDGTAEQARRREGVRVLELPIPGKARALNAGDKVAVGFPRIYLDADVEVTTQGLRDLLEAVGDGDAAGFKALACTGRRVVDARGCPWMVRGYSAISTRLPAFRTGLFGRGVLVLSESARRRFGSFPEYVADDLFVDSLFVNAEKREVATVPIVIRAPRTTMNLIRRLARVRRGNSSLRTASARRTTDVCVRNADRWSWLRDVVLPRPWLLPAGVAYVVVSLAAAILARRNGSTAWERDESTR